MQNVQNAEIQQRVINLVELYRTKVGKESQIAKDAKAENNFWEDESIDMMIEDGLDFGGMHGEGPHTKKWIKHLKVNEQLLGHFYAEVAGKDAKQFVLDQLLPDIYDKTIFTEEEELFLKTHFKELINYIILTPCNESLEWVHRHDDKDIFTIPSEVQNLIQARVDISAGSKIYYPITGFAQLANLFNGCTFYCDTLFYAWTQVATYANGINVEALDADAMPNSYNAIVSYIPKIFGNRKDVTHIYEAYKNLPLGGKLVLLCPSELLWKKDTEVDNCPQDDLRKQLVHDNSIVEIIQLPSVMSPNLDSNDFCLLIAEKGHEVKTTTLLDARYAFTETKYSFSIDEMKAMGDDITNFQFKTTGSGRIVILSGPFGIVLDNKAIHEMIDNKGFLVKSGLRKMTLVNKSQLNVNNLIPQIYVIERPAPEIETIPLDSICRLVTTKVKSLNFDLPMETPWIRDNNLSCMFQGALDISSLEKADCPNIPPHTSDYEFDEDGKFIEDEFHYLLGWGTPKGMRVTHYRASTYLDGKYDVVIFSQEENNVKTSIYRSTGKPAVVESDSTIGVKVLVFKPSHGVDALTLTALLKMPVVYRQIQAYEKFGLQGYLKDILVPWNRLIIDDEENRLLAEESAFKAQEKKYNEMKTEYINEVRMRKHDMRPHMKQLNSAKNLMQHYVDNMDKIDDVKQHLNHQLARFRDALGHLSDLIEHLSDEEKFGESERFSLIDYFKELISESNNDIYIDFDDVAIENYIKKKIYEYSDYMKEQAKLIAKGLPKGEMPKARDLSYVMIAPLDFDRMVQNILENARKHGFTDSTRSDYMIWIMISVDEKRNMYVIDFNNNGTPLPEGMTKERYGIKGEKAGLNGGTGSGGYIVKSIVTHYGGDYDVFYNDENQLTTVRVYLPIATI